MAMLLTSKLISNGIPLLYKPSSTVLKFIGGNNDIAAGLGVSEKTLSRWNVFPRQHKPSALKHSVFTHDVTLDFRN